MAQSCAIELFRKASKVIRNRGGYWQVKVYTGLDPLTGKQRFEYDRAKTKREAVRVEAALKTKVAEVVAAAPPRTVADLVERWYEWRQGVKEISPTTLEGYRRQIVSASSRRSGASRFGAWTWRPCATASTPSCVNVANSTAACYRPAPSAPSTPCCPGRCGRRWPGAFRTTRPAWPPRRRCSAATAMAPPPVEQVAGLLATALERNPRLGLFLRLAVVLGAEELCAALAPRRPGSGRGPAGTRRGLREPAAPDRQAHQDPQQAAPRPGRRHGGLLRAHRERSEQVARELGVTLPDPAPTCSAGSRTDHGRSRPP